MKGLVFFSLVIIMTLISSNVFSQDWIQEKYPPFTLFYTDSDKENKDAYLTIVDAGLKSVHDFFGDTFRYEFQMYVHPNRQSLDKQWQKDWGMPEFKSECWMVASGVATKLDLISPIRWKDESCEHNYSDLEKTQQLINHELFHVYHGQLNASPDFSDVTNIDWFVEGFATYASGQLDAPRLDAVKQAMRDKVVSSSLDNFWTGKLKYGLSGSVVKYIDQKYGRKKLHELLKYNKKEEILSSLGISEKDLLLGWSQFMEPGAQK